MLCRCQETSKALVEQALAHGSLLFIHASEQQQQDSVQSEARIAAMQCVTDEEYSPLCGSPFGPAKAVQTLRFLSAEAIVAERPS